MGLLLGIVSALCLGVSDLFAARTTRTAAAVSVTRTALLTSACVSPLLLLIDDSAFGGRDVAIGVLSGVALSLALLLLYRGYSQAPMGIVAPVCAVFLAGVPVAYDLLRGADPSTLALVGMAVGTAALAPTSYSPGGTGSIVTAVILGVFSGSLFGVAFVLMDATSDAAGLSPVACQRSAGFVLLACLQRLDRAPLVVTSRPGWRTAVASGVFGGAGMGALQLGFRNGAAGPVSVAASQFGAAAVVLSVIFNRERLRWWQVGGVAGSTVGVALMALG